MSDAKNQVHKKKGLITADAENVTHFLEDKRIHFFFFGGGASCIIAVDSFLNKVTQNLGWCEVWRLCGDCVAIDQNLIV